MKSQYLLILLLFTLGINSNLWGQLANIIITEQTLKLKKKEQKEFTYAFAQGDQMLISIEVANNNHLEFLEVMEYPNEIKFSKRKVTRLAEKPILVNKTGAYTFKIKNGKNKSICRIKIQRIPKSTTTVNFNTTVKWIEKYDTIYTDTLVQVTSNYTVTVKKKGSKRGVINTEYQEEIILDRTERVQGFFNMSEKNRRYFKVVLPKDELSSKSSKKLKAWVYWLANSKEADAAWAKNIKAMSRVGQGLFKFVGSYGPLASYALGTVTELIIPYAGDDVEYYFLPDIDAASSFMSKHPSFKYFDKGRGTGGYAKHSASENRSFYIGLSNDNMVKDIDVKIKIAVIWEIEHYGDIPNTAKEQRRRKEQSVIKKPKFKKIKVPVY